MSKMTMHETIHRAKIAFEMAGIKAPNLIVLSDNRDGVRLMAEMDNLASHLGSLHPVRGLEVARIPILEPMLASNFCAGSADYQPEVTATVTSLPLPHSGRLVEDEEGRKFMEVNVLGIRVRWPAKCILISGRNPVWY